MAYMDPKDLLVTRMSEYSRQLADEAAGRGWRYAPRGDDLRLAKRWQWSVRFDHPFKHGGSGGRGLDRRTPVCDVVSGATPAGRAFWAFWFPFVHRDQHGSFTTRTVAFIHTATSLPTVSVVKRGSLGSRWVKSALDEWKARRVEQWAGGETERSGRLHGWSVGSEAFRREYKVDADDRQGAEWLAGPRAQQRLLASDPPISITSNGADILAWTDYGGRHISRVEDYDLATVDALLEILDAVELASPTAPNTEEPSSG